MRTPSRTPTALACAALLGALTALPHVAGAQHRHHHRSHTHHAATAAPPTAAPPTAAPPPAAQGPAAPAAPPTAAATTATSTPNDTPPANAPAAPPPVTSTAEAPPPVSQVSTEPAESTPWTVRWRARPLTLPARVLRLDAAIGLDRSVVALGATRIASSSLSPWLRLGAGYGITHAVEVGITTTPLRIEAGAQFHDVAVYGRFRLMHEERFDLGVQIAAGYLHPERFAGTFTALLRWRFEAVRLDVAPSVDLFAGATNVVDLRVPVDIWWQLSPDFALGLRTGIIAPGFTDARLGIIVGARAVYSLGRANVPFVDLFVSFDAEPLIHFSGTIFRDDFVIVQLGAQTHFGP
ncbi:MAG: hypothetical protein U0325_01750 [Polyangiales bacterium]